MRVRPSKDAITERRRALYNIVAEQRPMTVRQIYYQATVHGLVDKTEQGYERVSADLNVMRKSGELTFMNGLSMARARANIPRHTAMLRKRSTTQRNPIARSYGITIRITLGLVRKGRAVRCSLACDEQV